MKTTMTGKQMLNEANFKFMNEVFGLFCEGLNVGLNQGLFNADNFDTLFDELLKRTYDNKVESKLVEFGYLIDASSFPSFDEFMEKNSIELNNIHDDIKDFLKAA